MTRHTPFKRWPTWMALALLPFLSACFASSWSLPASQAVPDKGLVTLIPLYIPDYLKNDQRPSPYLYQPPLGSVISQFVTRTSNQEQALGFRLVSEPSDKGTFCTLYLRLLEPSTATQLSSLLSMLTYFLLPTYSGSMTFELTYDVFSDTHFVRQYRYQVHGKRLIWLFMPFAAPFMSGYWEPTIQPQVKIPDGLMQGLLSTLAQLKADGQRDGLFK